MEKQPDDKMASVAICRNPEFGEPDQNVIDTISRFIGNHYLLIDPVTRHTNVILDSDFEEAGGVFGSNKTYDEDTVARIQAAIIVPDWN